MPALHASAVAIGGEALVIRGPSRSGKSRLAVALIARATRWRQVVLVGDDRILLRPRPDAVIAAPHPRIAGFIERRGLGIVAMAWQDRAPVGGCVEIGPAPAIALLAGLPCLRIAVPCEAERGADLVLAWWTEHGEASSSHSSPKAGGAGR